MPRQEQEPYSKPQESLAATKAFGLQMSDAALLFHGPGAGFPRRLQQVPNAKEDHFPMGLTRGLREMVISFLFLVEIVYVRGPLLSGNTISYACTPQLWLLTVHTLWVPSAHPLLFPPSSTA